MIVRLTSAPALAALVAAVLAAVVAALVAAVVAAPALAADAAAASKCATTLSPEGKAMFKVSASSVKPDSAIPDVLRSNVAGLVIGGQMSRETAQANGPAVGKCLALLK